MISSVVIRRSSLLRIEPLVSTNNPRLATGESGSVKVKQIICLRVGDGFGEPLLFDEFGDFGRDSAGNFIAQFFG